MADQKTFERVCDVIRETAGLDDVEMKPESTLEEIGLDSLGTVEILVAVEDELGIQLDTEENPKTVGEFVDTVRGGIGEVEMLKTPLCDLLGIEKPVFQGGMAWIADASLASAVSEAGGLGIIAAMNADANWLRDQIHELRARTDKPFGVNVMLMSPFADEVAQVVIDERVPVVVTGAGNPAKYMKAWNEAGIKVIPVVASVALARLVARRGATAVVAEGTESGGHIGETSTMALVPQVVDAVDIPVVAAGGIADGRGVAAAFMLGAAGVQVGTRFLVADECTVSEQYKEMVLKANDTSTRATGRSTGHPVRALKSPFTNAYAKSEAAGASSEELGAMGTGALRKAAKDGNYEEGSYLCGQIAGMVSERQSAREIVDDLVDGAERVLKGACAWVA